MAEQSLISEVTAETAEAAKKKTSRFNWIFKVRIQIV